MGGNTYPGQMVPRSMGLGRDLLELREEAGVSQRELARRLGWDNSRISRYESGGRTPQAEDVAAYLTALGVTGKRYEDLVAFAREPSNATWLGVGTSEQNRQLAVLLRYEEAATHITDVSPLLIPGLLQTGGYAKAIMRAARVPEDEIPTRVAARRGRRDTITRTRNPAALHALVGEQALMQGVGGPAVMADQLRYLETACRASNISVRLMPLAASWHPGLEGPALLIAPDRASGLEPVVHLEGRRSGVFLSRKEDIDAYMEGVEMVRSVALTEAESAEVIAREAERWERKLDAVEEVQG